MIQLMAGGGVALIGTNPVLRGEKSSKQKRAEKLILEGQDIEIIDELTFYDILNN